MVRFSWRVDERVVTGSALGGERNTSPIEVIPCAPAEADACRCEVER